MDMLRQDEEVDRNYEAFKKLLPSILAQHRDKLALMRDEQIVGFFDSPRELLEAAYDRFADGIFSIQDVTDQPLDLGFWSHVAH